MSKQHSNQIRVCHLCMEECGTLKGGLILEDISFPQKMYQITILIFSKRRNWFGTFLEDRIKVKISSEIKPPL